LKPYRPIDRLSTPEASGFTAETARSQYKLTRKSTKMKIAGGFYFTSFFLIFNSYQINCFPSPQQEIFQREEKSSNKTNFVDENVRKKGEKIYKFVPKDVSMCFVCVCWVKRC
jgi:hypothetical protein